jgi:cytolysin (calcineurin-like family phosphatase)
MSHGRSSFYLYQHQHKHILSRQLFENNNIFKTCPNSSLCIGPNQYRSNLIELTQQINYVLLSHNHESDTNMDFKEITLYWFTEHTRSMCRYPFAIGMFSNKMLNIALGIFLSASNRLKTA